MLNPSSDEVDKIPVNYFYIFSFLCFPGNNLLEINPNVLFFQVFIGGKLRRRPNLSKADKSYMHLRTVKSLPTPTWLNYTLTPLSSSPRDLLPALSRDLTRDLSRDLTRDLSRDLLASPHLVPLPLYSDLASTLSRPSAFSAITRGISDSRISTLDRLMLSPLSALGLQTLKNSTGLDLSRVGEAGLRLDDKR